MFAALSGEGRGVLIEVEGGRVERLGEDAARGIAVAAGGRRVVIGHRNPNRCEVRGGEARTIRVDDLGCVSIVERGGGMILVSGNEVLLIR